LNLDKSVNKLIDRIDKLDSSNGNNKSDGIDYWKGKKIISLEEWFQISRTNNLSNPDKHRIKEGLEYFPNGYCEMIFPLGVPDEIREDVNGWHKDYIELMNYTKNENLGKRKCRDCLLCPNNEGSYFGLYKFIANALAITQSDDLKTNGNTLSTYPCQVVNFYTCPYENDKRDGNQVAITRNDLFSLNQITEIIGRALSKALNVKGNRIIYKIDFQSAKVQEVDTFLHGDPYAKNLPGALPIEYKLNERMGQIETLSLISMRNLDDIFAILTDKEKMDTVFQIGLDKKYLEHKDELIQFFISIKGNAKREDLTRLTSLIFYVEKNKCSICSQPANINCTNCFDRDVWLCVGHWHKHRDRFHNSISFNIFLI
jgi:hypothetical protein